MSRSSLASPVPYAREEMSRKSLINILESPAANGPESRLLDDLNEVNGKKDLTDELEKAADDKKPKMSVRDRIIGCVCLGIMIIAWVVMSEYLQSVEQGTHTGQKPYYKPLFMNYVVQSAFTLGIPVWFVWFFFIKTKTPSDYKPQITKKFVVSSIWFTLLLSACSYVWYISLDQTSISANTAIYNSNSIFVFIFSIFILKEKITVLKILAVLVCIAGVILITIFGSGQEVNGHKTTVFGFIMCTIAAAGYAITDVIYGKFMDDDEDAGMEKNFLWIGFMGLATFFTQWPFLILFHYAGWEIFELPSLATFGGLMANACLDTLLNTAIYIGIMYTSALFISVGQVLVMPASVVADIVLNKYLLPWEAFIGIGLVIAGFVMMNVAEYLVEREERRKELEEAYARAMSDVDDRLGRNESFTDQTDLDA